MIKGHGDDIYEYEGIKSDFSSNICAHNNQEILLSHLAEHPELISHYPEPEAWSLEKMIAERYLIDPQQVIVTSGATEAIYLIAQTFGLHPVIPTPTFSEYEDACKMFPRSAETVDISTGDREQKTMLWLCNPNNPTGEVYDQLYIDRMMAEHELVVLDHSYENYTDEHIMSPRWGCRTPHSIQIHSMTKRFSIPGLRLGYITAPAPVISRLRAHYRPWAVNALAIEAGKWLITHQDPNEQYLMDELLAEAQLVAKKLRGIFGIHVYPTKTNFMLCSIRQSSALELKSYLLEKHLFLIRDASNFEGLKACHFRIAAQRPEYNDELIKAIYTFTRLRNG